VTLIVPVPPPNTVQIVFRTNPQMFSGLIRWFEQGDWSHVEATVDKAHGGTIVAAQTAWQVGQSDPGVQNFKIDYDTWSTKQAIFRAEMSPRMYREFVNFLFDHVGRPFNNLGFWGLALHDLNITEKGSLFCSMLLDSALRAVKFWEKAIDIPENGVTPQLLFLMVAADPRWIELKG
jgi:hypothetical protein